MKKSILFFVFAIATSINSLAQRVNVPNIGEKILFYPVSDEFKSLYSGFDCFYDANAYAQGILTEKAKFRLNKNKDNLTPFSEIEGHTFFVTDTLNYTMSKNSKDARYLVFLNREDNMQIILSIPIYKDKKISELTSSMSYNIYTRSIQNMHTGTVRTITSWYNSTLANNICIPFINISKLDSIKHESVDVTYFRNDDIRKQYINKRHTDENTVENKYIEYVSYATNLLGKELKKETTKFNHVVLVKDVVFCDVKGLAFKQLAMKVSINGDTYFIPYESFISTGSYDFNYLYSFNTNYIKESSVYEKLIWNISEPYRSLKKGDNVYYGLNGHFIERLNMEELQDGYYAFERFYVRPGIYGYDMMAAFRDKTDKLYNVDAGTKWYKSNSYSAPSTFVSAFYIQSEADSILEANRKKALEDSLLQVQQEKENAEFMTMVTKKYGSQYTSYYNDLGKYSKEKFRTATKKWGAKIAKDICEGVVRLGWDRDKCRMSWGDPLDINTSIGSWGRHEQWCYRSSYLYFENDKLTSIQN